MRTGIATSVVDASAVVRRLLDPSRRLRRYFEDAAAPTLVVAEVSQAVLKYVRAGEVASDEAAGLLGDALDIPLELHNLVPLAEAALTTAVTLRLSVYDSFYAVLSRQLDVPLVTADRRLAAVAGNAVLID